MTDNFKLATVVGKYFKQHANMTIESWKTEKEYATVAEKAIVFSARSGKELNETITIKWDELKNGLILAKEHGFDDFTRGFVAGWNLENDTSDEATANLLDEVEHIWESKWFDTDEVNAKIEVYWNVIMAIKKKHMYKSMGMITVQELTRKCLSLMENGFGDKMVVTYPEHEYILSGDAITENEKMTNSLFLSSERLRNVDVDDIVILT
jgi:hypothetical protein